MSKKTLLALAMATALGLPHAAFGQIGIAARGGTLGVGGEAALGLGRFLQVRGGIGSSLNLSFKNVGISDGEYTLTVPKNLWNVGVDLFPFGGGFHLSAGLLNRPKWDLAGVYTGSAQFGTKTYTGTITAFGTMKNDKETGPFVGIGFGRTSKRGLGFSFDLGAASLGDGTITVTSYSCQSGTTNCTSQISQSDVNAEAKRIQDDMNNNDIASIHPILSFSLHYGFGK